MKRAVLAALPPPRALPTTAQPISYGLSPVLGAVRDEAQRELSLLRGEGGRILSSREIEGIVSIVAERLGLGLTATERDEVAASLEQEEAPFGVLQPLVDDPSVSDIIVTDFSRIAVRRGHSVIRTERAFPNQDAYEAFVERLLAKAGTTYSTKKPVADGMIGASARLHAVHRCLCDAGPYLTIRINRFSKVTGEDLVSRGMAPRELFAYLEGLIECGVTMLIVGEVGTGKTTLARSLAGSVPADESILVIEDTPEIRLEHPHTRYVQTREQNADGAGRITPSECIRAGMRMAMHRIIFGEIRDAEAAEAFIDVCASGHPGLSTIHARCGAEALTRLELFLGRAQRGVSRAVLNEQIVTAVQAIIFVDICRVTKQRRIMEVKEIGPVADGMIRQRDMFRYDIVDGLPVWRVVNKLSAHREALERLEQPIVLSSYPSLLEPDVEQSYREASRRSGEG